MICGSISRVAFEQFKNLIPLILQFIECSKIDIIERNWCIEVFFFFALNFIAYSIAV